VADEIDILLNNLDASKVIITSDHGQALGEHFLWDHFIGVNHPSMKFVPWIECSAKDEKTLNPSKYKVAQFDNFNRQKRLKVLGYL
jgi:hypothetical protein